MPEALIGFNGLDLLIVLGTVASIYLVGADALRVYREGAEPK
jgi:hypothetical protein